jgi:predicted metal-dependent hydrolase
MKEFVCALVIVLALLVIFSKLHAYVVDDRVSVKASDGRSYTVRNTEKKQETAEALARLNQKILTFINRLVSSAESDFKIVALRLKKRYNPSTLSEGRIDKRYTSYTVNKGEEVVLCLRTRDAKDQIYDDNLITYITLHELAHIAAISEGHNREFHKIFRYLLHKATEWGLFRKVSHSFNYCGIPNVSM